MGLITQQNRCKPIHSELCAIKQYHVIKWARHLLHLTCFFSIRKQFMCYFGTAAQKATPFSVTHRKYIIYGLIYIICCYILILLLVMIISLKSRLYISRVSIRYLCGSLTLIWVGFLEVRFAMGGCLKLLRIMLETWNLEVSTHANVVSKNMSFSTKNPLILYFFAKNQHCFAKIVSLLKAIVWELCLRFFSFSFSFCKIKGYCLWKCTFYRPCIRIPSSGLL